MSGKEVRADCGALVEGLTGMEQELRTIGAADLPLLDRQAKEDWRRVKFYVNVACLHVQNAKSAVLKARQSVEKLT